MPGKLQRILWQACREEQMNNEGLLKKLTDNECDIKLFCFPYAGGGASAYSTIGKKLAGKLEVFAMQLPGREEKIMKSAYTSLESVAGDAAKEIKPHLGSCIIFWGHSMGARIAFEVAQKLESEGSWINHLIVSGNTIPEIPPRIYMKDLPDAAFKEELHKMAGTPRAVIENQELMDIFIPILRADFALAETDCVSGQEPLDCPITAWCGSQDKEAKYTDVLLWKKYTKQFTVKVFEGDHFFIKDQEDEVIKEIVQISRDSLKAVEAK